MDYRCLKLIHMNNIIFSIGIIGQALFTGRVLVQWLASEKAGTSIVPPSYWLLSLIGSALLLAYACLRQDPVFILGQSFGIFVYLRNLQLLRKAVLK